MELTLSEPTDTPRFDVLKSTPADELAARKGRQQQERDKATLDKNQAIAKFWREQCKGMTQRQAGEKIAAEFGGSAATHASQVSRVYAKIQPDDA